MNWITRIIAGVVAAIIVYLVCVFVGGLLLTVEVPIVVAVGTFLKTFASLLSIVAFLWAAFLGGSLWPRP